MVENVIQIKSGMTVNVGASVKIKLHRVCEKDYIWNPATCSCENGKYLASVIDDSMIRCGEIIEMTKTIPTKTIPTKSTSTICTYILGR